MLEPDTASRQSVTSSSQRALVPTKSESTWGAELAAAQSDPRFSAVEQLVCNNLGYTLRAQRERRFPWLLYACSFAVACAMVAGYFAASQAGRQVANARLMLDSYEEVATALLPRAVEALTTNASALGRTLSRTVVSIDAQIGELPGDAERSTQLQLSVLEKPNTSAWGIQLAFGKLRQLQDSEGKLRRGFFGVLANSTTFLHREWARQSAPLVPLLADLKGICGVAPTVLAALRQTAGCRILEWSGLIPGLQARGGWGDGADELQRLLRGGSVFLTAERRLAKVMQLIESLQTGLEDAVAALKEEAELYNATLARARAAMESFRIGAEGRAREGGGDADASGETDAWLRGLMGRTERLFLQLQMHAKGARDSAKRIARQSTAEPASMREQLEKAKSEMSAELAGIGAMHSWVALSSVFYEQFLPAFCSSLFALAVGIFLVGFYIEYRFEHSVRQEALANPLYMRGLCAYHESASRFDGTLGESLCNPVARQCLRIRHALLYHPGLGIIMGALAVLASAAAGLLALVCLFLWNQGQMASALAPLCGSPAAQALTSDEACTSRIRDVARALDVEVFREAAATCESRHLLVCFQLVEPLAGASVRSAAVFLAAAAPLAALWPLLQRQLASVFAEMLVQARSASDV